ncbi:YD repeat-containing protein [Mucilaginibacter sp. SG538B]|uniref:PKD domain-containing protein n=1 Tax=Mucilaginibacter sp. SG538B TaxID=2587021 RepID=UPI001800F2F0|nr:PKD domain-containing protein [Mucilaginibacter sp. SG538B]NVM62176.1 YD repeat-containing protein [Mucilaginibacter sp. SG538B]
MRRIIFLFLLSLLFNGFASAQIGVPVNLQTGSPTIHIPIYEIRNGDVSVPVSLSYTPGVKIAQSDGNDDFNIGVGWRVDAGGTISRSVKGLPDDYQGAGADTRMGWLYGTGAAGIPGFNPQSRTDCNGDVSNYNTLNTFANNNTDTEPDVFNFNFGGYSGQFVFDNNKVIRTMPYQDLSIVPSYSASGAIISFTVTANDGKKYTFIPVKTITKTVTPGATINKVYYLRDKLFKYAQQISYTITWGLSDVTSPAGGYVSLGYGGTQQENNANLEIIDSAYANPSATDIYLADNTSAGVYKKSIYYTKTKVDTKLLSSIWDMAANYAGNDAGHEHLQFFYTPGFISVPDLNKGIYITHQTSVLLTSFKVYAGTSITPARTIILNRVGTNGYTFLQSLHEFADNCTVTPPYQFEYLGTNLVPDANGFVSTGLPLSQNSSYNLPPPSLTYRQQDYWGYYNANNATTLVPNLYMYPNEPSPEKYRIQPIPGYSGTSNVIAGGADRTVNPNAIVIGSLYRIIYPTGGSVKLDYEPNQYVDTRSGQTFLGGGIRVKTVTLHDGINTTNDIVKNYTYSGGVLLNRPQFAFSIPVYTDVSGGVHTIGEYSDQPTQARYFTALSEYDLNPYDSDSPDVLYQSGTESQAGIGKQVYQYSNPATFGQTSSAEYASPNQWQATYSQYATTTDPSSGLCMSKGLLADGYYTFPYPSNPNYTFERGLLQSVKSYNETGQLVKESDYQYTPVYKNTSPVSIYGLSYDYFTYNPNDVNTKAFAYGKYRLFGDMTKYQTITIDKTYDPGTNFTKVATVENDAFYNGTNHSQLSSTKTTTSNDGTNVTTYTAKFKYPQDYTASSGADPVTAGIIALKNANMNNTVIEKTSSITKPGQSEQVISAQLTKFNVFSIPNPQYYNTAATFSTRVLPSQTLFLKTNSPLTNFTPSTVDNNNLFKYDSRYQVSGNITEYSTIGNPVSMDDGHQQLSAVLYDVNGIKPVAIIKNATANQVLYSNFEDEYPTLTTQHTFNEPPTGNYSQVNGRIGKALTVAPPNFTFTGTVSKGAGLNYIFSCWVSAAYAGSLTVTLTDAGGHNVSSVIPYTNTSGVWIYYRAKLPVSSLNPTFNISIQASNVPVTVDDMLFYPELATVALTGYQMQLKTAETDLRGNTIYYTYDGLRRPTVVTDQNQNILKRLVYNYRTSYALNALFNMPATANTNTAVNFVSGPVDPCEPAQITRNWDFGDGTTLANGGTSPSHTYTAPGNYTVKLTVTHPQYGTVSTTQNITVYVQLAYTMHLNGIAAYNVCSNQIILVGDQPLTNPPGTDTFTASVSGSYNNQFLWEQAFDTSPNNWVTLPGTTNTITVTVPHNPDGSISSSQTYTLRCTMVPQQLQKAAVQTTKIIFLAPNCNK